MTTRIKGGLSKIIIIDTKYAADLIDLVSKNKITYDKVKLIFNDKILKSVNTVASEKPSENRTKLLKTFFDLGEVFTGKFSDLKILDDKNEVTELKKSK